MGEGIDFVALEVWVVGLVSCSGFFLPAEVVAVLVALPIAAVVGVAAGKVPVEILFGLELRMERRHWL